MDLGGQRARGGGARQLATHAPRRAAAAAAAAAAASGAREGKVREQVRRALGGGVARRAWLGGEGWG